MPARGGLGAAASARRTPGRRGLPQAWLVAAKDEGGLAEIDRLILHQAVTVIALELLRRRVADTTERRLAGDILSAAITGELEGPSSAAARAVRLGGRVTTLVLAPGERRAEACERALSEALRGESVSALVAQHGRFVCALMPGYLDDELFELGERVRSRVAAATGSDVPRAQAASSPQATCARAGTRRASRSRRARCPSARRRERTPAATAPAPLGPSSGARDLSRPRLVPAAALAPGLRRARLYCDSLLGPIENGEGHYGGELMRSLEAFIECNGQWEAAARRLYCHRHTLRYRIRKIEELHGPQPRFGARPDRVLARACAGARSSSRCAARSTR